MTDIFFKVLKSELGYCKESWKLAMTEYLTTTHVDKDKKQGEGGKFSHLVFASFMSLRYASYRRKRK